MRLGAANNGPKPLSVVASQVAAAKRLNLSVDEMRRITVSQLLDLVDATYPDDDEPRMATQADIDRLA